MREKIIVGRQYKTNTCGTLEVVKLLEKRHVRVRFLDTGYEVTCHSSNLSAGKVKDPTQDKFKVGMVFSSNYGEFIIIKKTGRNCQIQFKNTGSIRTITSNNIETQNIKDNFARTVLGVGYYGDVDKTKPYWLKAKQLWNNIMKRCYSDKDPKGYKKFGVTVSDNWQCFANFLNDINKLDGFSNWLNEEGYELDKDIILPNNKIYGQGVCKFVPKADNLKEQHDRKLAKN